MQITQKLTAHAQMRVKAPKQKVWEALTTPRLIEKYLFGTNAISDWKVGSPLIFKGEWQGKTYEDKGTILAADEPNHFKYTYWSSMSGTEDAPENYAEVSYDVEDAGNGETELRVTQNNVADEKVKKHSEENWAIVLNGLKKVVEEG